MKNFARRRINDAGWEVSRRPPGPPLRQFTVELPAAAPTPPFEQIGTFEASDGQPFPIYRGYRYALKPCWNAIPALRNLFHVINAAGLPDNDVQRFKAFVGTHTITAPIRDIDAFAEPILREHADLFETGSLDHGVDCVPRLSDEDYQRQISTMARWAAAEIEAAMDGPPPHRLRILDVGCGRGISTLAYGQLGHDAVGLDNNYDGSAVYVVNDHIRQRLSSIAGNRATFETGDITCCPELPDASFDLIVSSSCLEHIRNIDAALNEMFRLLKPGGLMVHHYNHFWAENGAHVLGLLSAPWLHAMLSDADHHRYIAEQHPHEQDLAAPWIRNALNRDLTIGSMQASLAKAGFILTVWREAIGDARKSRWLSLETLAHARAHQPDVSLADLMATDIFFVARRP